MTYFHNNREEYKQAEEQAEKKARILECQWSQKESNFRPLCESCHDRFICHTVTAKKFEIVECRQEWTNYHIFAEDKSEAMNLWGDFICNDNIVYEAGSDCSGSETEIEELEPVPPALIKKLK